MTPSPRSSWLAKAGMPASLAMVATLGLPGLTSMAAATDAELASELKALREKVQQLESAQQNTQHNWLEQRRTEEINSLVDEVIEDADQRTSFAAGAVAGHGKKFFVASEDGNFLMEMEGQVQFRYILNNIDDTAFAGDSTEGGFQMRRAKLGFAGHIYDPSLQYKIKAGFERAGGGFTLEEAYGNWKLTDGQYLKIGQFKGRFNAEELVSSSKAQAVERTGVNEFFTLDYSQGVEFGGAADKWNWSVVWHDGREIENVDFGADHTEWAFAGRVEALLAGSFKQFGDYQAWSGEKDAIRIGAGFDWEKSERGVASNWDDFFQWTVDFAMETNGFNLFAAVIGRTINGQSAGDLEADQIGMVVQAGYFLVPNKWDIFARWEQIDHDGLNELDGNDAATSATVPIEDKPSVITFGTNWYIHKHNAKFTLDYSIAADGVMKGESGLGTRTDNASNDQQVIRAQFQLLF